MLWSYKVCVEGLVSICDTVGRWETLRSKGWLKMGP